MSDCQVVHVVSRRAPSIGWFCSACHGQMPFDCSERFRANSNGKLVDIWLIYRCRRCDRTKNISIVERTPVRRVPPRLLAAAEGNDLLTARALARDVGIIRRNKAEVVEGDSWQIAGSWRNGSSTSAVVLRFDEPLLVRLDSVIATVLGVSRGSVRDRHAARTLAVDPTRRIDVLRLWASATVTPAGG